jgi:hypothetical protein
MIAMKKCAVFFTFVCSIVAIFASGKKCEYFKINQGLISEQFSLNAPGCIIDVKRIFL